MANKVLFMVDCADCFGARAKRQGQRTTLPRVFKFPSLRPACDARLALGLTKEETMKVDPPVSRRDFLTRSAGGVAAVALGPLAVAAEKTTSASDRITIAISTASFGRAFREKRLDILDFPGVCARAGLEAIELNDFCLKGDWAIIREMKRLAAQHGLGICAVAAETNFYRATQAEVGRERAHLEQYLDIADYLGAPRLRVNTCPYNKNLPAAIIPKGVTDEMAFEAAVQTFRSLVPAAGKKSITLVLENHGGISRTSADQIRITKAVGSKWFRINLDTGNYHADPMAGTEPFEDFLEATVKVAPYLAFCHGKIWDVTDDLREPTLDYDKFFALLRRIGYRGPVSIEYMGRKDVMDMLPKCVALMKRCRGNQRD